MILSFASNLKFQLNKNEMKPSELAKEIGKNKSSISQYLSGKNIPKDNVKQNIANVLGCTVEDLDTESKQDIELRGNNVPVWKAAMLLDKSDEFIRVSLQMGTAPFGFAAKKKSKWSYHISPKKFVDYIGNDEERMEAWNYINIKCNH